MSDLIGALTLLTILPVPAQWNTLARTPGKSLTWFPAIGLVLGVVLLMVLTLARAVFSDLLAAALVVAAWAALTGALHLEGLADCGDAIAATATPERRQEIMHDPHLGAFGVVAVLVVVLCKFSAVANLRNAEYLVLAPVLARWAIVLAMVFPLARTTGMAATFRKGLSRWQLLAATVWAAATAAIFGWRGAIAFVAAAVVVLLFAWLAHRRLGGMNGDVYGGIVEVVEVVILMLGVSPAW